MKLNSYYYVLLTRFFPFLLLSLRMDFCSSGFEAHLLLNSSILLSTMSLRVISPLTQSGIKSSSLAFLAFFRPRTVVVEVGFATIPDVSAIVFNLFGLEIPACNFIKNVAILFLLPRSIRKMSPHLKEITILQHATFRYWYEYYVPKCIFKRTNL